MPAPSTQELRAALLAAIEHFRPRDQVSRASWQAGSILDYVSGQYGPHERGPDFDTMLLDEWSELFRTGHLVWGFNLNMPDPPFFHVSKRGELALRQLARDPVNPPGYLAYLDAEARPSALAQAYIAEGLACFNCRGDCKRHRLSDATLPTFWAVEADAARPSSLETRKSQCYIDPSNRVEITCGVGRSYGRW